jgi:alpha-amylase/alpha-mannosidase (GH57 family)
MVNKEHIIVNFPRYYELYFKKQKGLEFNTQDYLDLQVWFNLSWFDPSFRENLEALKKIVYKARFFSEEDKHIVLEQQINILKDIIPAYKEFILSQQVEVSISPYYHPILPLLYNTKIAKEANPKCVLPKINFSYPQDAQAQINQAVKFYLERFGGRPYGMWPSEEAVSEHILPFIIQAGLSWIVTDEAILFKSLKKKKRDTTLLYQPHLLKRKDGNLNIIFRDRNLSDLIGFCYQGLTAESAVKDFLGHLKNIADFFKKEDVLVCIAMDGENAWEHFTNDGHDFLELLYQELSKVKFLKTTTINEYLKSHPPKSEIKHLASGSWIYGEFGKWIGNPYKVTAWEYLAQARKELAGFSVNGLALTEEQLQKAYKQIYIAEGSDWFWWYGDKQADFDRLFRMHLSNFYTLLNKDIPDYLEKPIEP